MKKKLSLPILVAIFSFLFFAANAQDESAVRMPTTELTEANIIEAPKIITETIPNSTYQKEVSEQKTIEKKEVIKKVNNLKANAKILKNDRIKKNLKAEQSTVSQNVKIAIVLIVIGAILTIFPILWIIGLILVLVGLILLLLEII
ncbi:MAG: hypothetical protein OHK0045_11670 [Raineya sp.]